MFHRLSYRGRPSGRQFGDAIGGWRQHYSTARKLAVLVYHVLKGDFVYRDPGADGYDAQQRARQLRQLRHRATRLGFTLVSHDTGEVPGG